MTNLRIVAISHKGRARYLVMAGEVELQVCLTELEAQQLITDELGSSTQVIRSELTFDPPKKRFGAYGES